MTSPLELVEQHYRNVSSADIDAEDELFSPTWKQSILAPESCLAWKHPRCMSRGSSVRSPTASSSSNQPLRPVTRLPSRAPTPGLTPAHCVVRSVRYPPTNRPVNLEFSDLFEIDGNRITRHRIYYDQVQFMSQLGLMQ